MKKWIIVFLIIDLLLVSIFCFLYFNNLLTNPPRIINNLSNVKFFNNLKENFKNFSSKLSSSISNFYNNIFKNKEEPASEVKNPKKEVAKENQSTEEEKKQIESKIINKKEIELEEIWKYHYGNYFCIFGFLKNMSSDYAATNVSLSYSLFDSEENTVLRTSKILKISYILPGQSAPFSLVTEISNDIHFESYEIDTIRCSWILFDIEDTFEFDVSNVDLTYYNSHNLVNGFVKNISEKDFYSAKILVAFYDEKERIIAVGSDYLVNLKVGENIPFIVDTENLPCIQKKAKNIEVFLFPQFNEI